MKKIKFIPRKKSIQDFEKDPEEIKRNRRRFINQFEENIYQDRTYTFAKI